MERIIRRGVHESDWVGLRGFFDLTHNGGSKKINPTQPSHKSNSIHMGWVGSG